MRRLGISVYPEHSTPEADRAYLERAAAHGFTRIFTCLLSVDKGADETIEEFGSFISYAHDLGFMVAVDTNETVFERLGATPFDIAPFAKMGVDIIRLDSHFGDRGNIALTRNPYGIGIEFNASHNHPLANLIERGTNAKNMVACHNFYPEPYTGLCEEYFERYSKIYKDLSMPLAAFVSSQQPDTFEPWPVFAGLPTCEDDRHRPIDLQVRHVIASGLVDDVIVGNCFASEEELAAMASVDLSRVRCRIDLDEGISEAEREIVFDFDHSARPRPVAIHDSLFVVACLVPRAHDRAARVRRARVHEGRRARGERQHGALPRRDPDRHARHPQRRRAQPRGPHPRGRAVPARLHPAGAPVRVHPVAFLEGVPCRGEAFPARRSRRFRLF